MELWTNKGEGIEMTKAEKKTADEKCFHANIVHSLVSEGWRGQQIKLNMKYCSVGLGRASQCQAMRFPPRLSRENANNASEISTLKSFLVWKKNCKLNKTLRWMRIFRSLERRRKASASEKFSALLTESEGGIEHIGLANAERFRKNAKWFFGYRDLSKLSRKKHKLWFWWAHPSTYCGIKHAQHSECQWKWKLYRSFLKRFWCMIAESHEQHSIHDSSIMHPRIVYDSETRFTYRDRFNRLKSSFSPCGPEIF